MTAVGIAAFISDMNSANDASSAESTRHSRNLLLLTGSPSATADFFTEKIRCNDIILLYQWMMYG
jgi:hypothetical protein